MAALFYQGAIYMLKIIKLLSIFLLSILTTILLYSFTIYLMTPVYTFPKAEKFNGDMWYNPYEDYDNAEYRRANFHAHSIIVGGLTNGRSNTDIDVFQAYNELGYEFATISNYQSPTRQSYYDFPYIPTQEYGINIFKTHFLLIGNNEPAYLDQILMQDIHTKQFRIYRYKPTTKVLVLNHPAFLNGFNIEDMVRLTGYDLMEVFNDFAISLSHWDKALSSGKPSFLIAGDDSHNVFNNRDIGGKINMVPLTRNDIRNDIDKLYDTLKYGSIYAIVLNSPAKSLDRKLKKELLDSYPVLKSIQVKDNALMIRLSDNVDTIKFITDNGMEALTLNNTDNGTYIIKDQDSYVRIEVVLQDDTKLYFNPIIRSIDGSKPVMPIAEKDYILTALKRIILISILLIISIFIYRKILKRKRC